jgi:hypothetical protein
MVSMPRKPMSWGDDLNDIWINRNPSGDAPATVTGPDIIMSPVPPFRTDPMARGTAPDPETYATLGEMAGAMLSDPQDPTGDFQAGGLMYNLGQLLAFHRGGPLDTQVRHHTKAPYANYVFGVYNAARGADLGDVLDQANLYGKLFSTYKNQPMDSSYRAIPA